MRRRIVAAPGLTVLLLAFVALPVLATKSDQAHDQKASITISGTVEVTTDTDGHAAYSLKDGATTYTLDVGPPWFFGDKNPLKPFVGKHVTIEGEAAQGSTEVEVLSINGTALREPGKPPWAGGWRVVGSTHPGWSQEKADRMKARFGDCFPPGQCKEKPAHTGEGANEPDESEAPD